MQSETPVDEGTIEVLGARVHNLKNIDVSIPRNTLAVITGLSGSGKSSLAFDTIYAEGQRRYVETFSAYARQFLGGLERPDVDQITGLSPVISIEQKTTNKNPRSTVGTITEIYDFLRLLFARVADAYSYVTGEKMISYTDDQIEQLILEAFAGKRIHVLAPLVKSRKGHYRELFEQIAKQGFVSARVDGQLVEISRGMRLDRYKTHDIEVSVDRFTVTPDVRVRMQESIKTALQFGNGVLMIYDMEGKTVRYFSKNLMCPTTGIAYPLPEPNAFSFNSPKGACPTCNGLGKIQQVALDKIIPDPTISIKKGGLKPLGEFKKTWIFSQLEILGDHFGFTLTTPIKDIPEAAMRIILHGAE